MKFSGLILICATSCLALILPAIGVVQFPKNSTQATFPAITEQQSLPISAQNPQSSMAREPWNPASTQRDQLPGAGNMPPSPFPGTPPSLNNLSSTDPTVAAVNAAAPSSQKLGLGIWLLLAPICLIGLAMWTFSPNPSGSKPRPVRNS